MTPDQIERLCEVDPKHFRLVNRIPKLEWSPTGKPLAGYSINGHPGECYWWMLTQLPDVALVSPNGSSNLWDCEDSRLDRYCGRALTPGFAVIEAYIHWRQSISSPTTSTRQTDKEAV